MSRGAYLITQERKSHQKRWTRKHDKEEHWNGDLARAAAVYALPLDDRDQSVFGKPLCAYLWPWDWENDYRPDISSTLTGRVKELVKAGALIAAEIDRLLDAGGRKRKLATRPTSFHTRVTKKGYPMKLPK